MTECTRTREALPEYSDGRLGSVRAGEVRAHLDRCADCRREEALLQGTWNVLENYPEINADLLTPVRRKVRGPWVRFLKIAAPVAAAAAVLLAVFLVVDSTPKPAPEAVQVQVELEKMSPEDRSLLIELAKDENKELIENMELLRSLELLGAEKLGEDPFNGH
jgi:anti-sigma factor RsiW